MRADGPRQQVELGFAAYFRLVVSNEAEFRLLYGRDHADDQELGRALRAVEDAIAEAIDPLIDAGLDDDHRRLLAYGIVGMAEGASRRFIEQRPGHGGRGGRGGPAAGPSHGRPGLGRPALGPRRLTSPDADGVHSVAAMDGSPRRRVSRRPAEPPQLVDARARRRPRRARRDPGRPRRRTSTRPRPARPPARPRAGGAGGRSTQSRRMRGGLGRARRGTGGARSGRGPPP